VHPLEGSPPDLWVDRVPARFRDDCPRIVEVDSRQAWLWQGDLTYIPMGSCRPLPGFDEAGYPCEHRSQSVVNEHREESLNEIV
jgi:hypothetical protein